MIYEYMDKIYNSFDSPLLGVVITSMLVGNIIGLLEVLFKVFIMKKPLEKILDSAEENFFKEFWFTFAAVIVLMLGWKVL